VRFLALCQGPRFGTALAHGVDVPVQPIDVHGQEARKSDNGGAVMRAFTKWSALAMLVVAWPGYAAQAQEYTVVFEAYVQSIERSPRSFHEWLAFNHASGRFDGTFLSCLTALERSWLAMSRQRACDAYEPGSLEKAECYGQDSAGQLISWSQDLRSTLAGRTRWDETTTGGMRPTGDALCEVLGAQELCSQFAAIERQHSTAMRSMLVCRVR
jgi:hypothetical protein